MKGTGLVPEGRKGRKSKTAAIILTCPRMFKVMGEARKLVNLKNLGIANVQVKHVITGALILEIPGPMAEGATKAKFLAVKMR